MIRLPSIDTATIARLITLKVEADVLRALTATGTAAAESGATATGPIDQGNAVPPPAVARMSHETMAAVVDLQRPHRTVADTAGLTSSEHDLVPGNYRQVAPFASEPMATPVAAAPIDPFVQDAAVHTPPSAIPVSVVARGGREVEGIARGSHRGARASIPPTGRVSFLSARSSVRLIWVTAGLVLLASVLVLTC